jgi:hypothetical protein
MFILSYKWIYSTLVFDCAYANFLWRAVHLLHLSSEARTELHICTH